MLQRAFTFAGISYDHDPANGKPVVIGPTEEIVMIEDGVLRFDVPDSSAAVVLFV